MQTQKIGSGKARRFDQRKTMFSKPRDPELSGTKILDMGKRHYGARTFKDGEDYTLLDWSFAMGFWYLEQWWGFGNLVGNEDLYQWYPEKKIAARDMIPKGLKWDVSDPSKMTRVIKKAATYMRASSGMGYSMMAHLAASLAHFIRDLGFDAIPCCNDTALSIPTAIDAGLGGIGRNGLLIAPGFGPRVRSSEVFTTLPLIPDKPDYIGGQKMCNFFGWCARACPGQAISRDMPTNKGPRPFQTTTEFTNGISILKMEKIWES